MDVTVPAVSNAPSTVWKDADGFTRVNGTNTDGYFYLFKRLKDGYTSYLMFALSTYTKMCIFLNSVI